MTAFNKTTENDSGLIKQYLNGDEKSLEIIIAQYLKPIYSFVYRYVGNSHDAQDITQETFVRVWKNIKKFDQEKNFKAWLFTIAKNASLDFLRKNKTLPSSAPDNEEGLSILETLPDSTASANELLEQKDSALLISSAVEKLSPEQRLALLAHYNDGLTFREISESFNEPLHTIKSRCRRALATLKKLLKQ